VGAGTCIYGGMGGRPRCSRPSCCEDDQMAMRRDRGLGTDYLEHANSCGPVMQREALVGFLFR